MATYNSVLIIQFFKNVHVELRKFHIGFIHCINKCLRENDQITTVTFYSR